MSTAFLILPWLSHNRATPKKISSWQIKKKRVRSFSLITSLGGEKTPNPNEDAKALIPMGMSPSKLGLSCGLLIVNYEVA